MNTPKKFCCRVQVASRAKSSNRNVCLGSLYHWNGNTLPNGVVLVALLALWHITGLQSTLLPYKQTHTIALKQSTTLIQHFQNNSDSTTTQTLLVYNTGTRSNITQNHQNENIILYIHIGKTGGTTLDKVLRSNCEWYHGPPSRKACFQQLQLSTGVAQPAATATATTTVGETALSSNLTTKIIDTESMLSKFTKASLHLNPREGYHKWIKRTTIFLVSIRNPISRAISAFNYDHPYNTYSRSVSSSTSSTTSQANNTANKNSTIPATKIPRSKRKFYVDCFPTVQDLATLIHRYQQMHNNNTNTTTNNTNSNYSNDTTSTLTPKEMECAKQGYQTLLGKGSKLVGEHLWYNMEHYAKLTFLLPFHIHTKILAIRTEHLWEDTKNVDRYLGGDGKLINEGKVQSHGSEHYTVQSGLTRQGESIFCCVLSKEIEIYEQLLRNAINLLDSEKEEALHQLYHQCNILEMADREEYNLPIGTNGVFSWSQWAKDKCLL